MDRPAITYKGLQQITGPLVIVEPKGLKPMFGELVRILTPEGERLGQVIEASESAVVVQVFEQTLGIDINSSFRMLGETLRIGVSEDMLGRIFNGRGEPIDGYKKPVAEARLDVNGSPINPVMRKYPHDFIQTGISTIDVMLTLVRGQKLPLFSGSGLPHNRLAVQIARQAKVVGTEEEFAVVFAAMGITAEEYNFFRKSLEESGAMERTVMFVNLANDPAIERIITPRLALTVAEYLAFETERHVLVILTDMTNYAEALREISAARNEIPGRRGYPAYLYSDLASIYERCGIVRGKNGSITLMPILTMPNDDVTHPVPDLTGYITEGQIYLSRALHRKGIYPPIDPLPSLSRLMREAIGKGKTTPCHKELADQLYAAYAEGVDLRDLVAVVGEEALSEEDKAFLRFADEFEQRFINQGETERDIVESIELGRELLAILPETRLGRISDKTLKKCHPKYRKVRCCPRFRKPVSKEDGR